MRPWTLTVLCATALLTLAGLLVGQEQGPNREPGATVARPRKPDAGNTAPDSDLPKIPSKLSKKNETDTTGLATFKSDVEVVSVDAAVLDNKGHFIPGIPAGNFRVLEDNVPQQIKGVAPGMDAPMTVAIVVEFSNLFQSFYSQTWYQTLVATYGFVETLKPEDYVAIVAYDLRPEMLTDFTQDRAKVQDALHRLNIPAFSESNLYDALTDTADRMSGIEGRKAIILIASGIDTFSKINYGEARKKLQESGVPVYPIGLMQAVRIMAESSGMMGNIQRLDFLQADNGMTTFARETGGMVFFPRFFGEFPTIFQSIHQALRSQYVITYDPSNKARNGAFRKIKVQLVNPATNEPLLIKDEKGKPIKYQIVAKAGYKAPREVE
ncbi:MAG TPA: VWA domain-containing protein [Bryobacteraceae bacterium]|jgi:Ca-activated chloride channel family protein|nr:VWA domain-containing protein [Bryobacteraceae bacterium]